MITSINMSVLSKALHVDFNDIKVRVPCFMEGLTVYVISSVCLLWL